MKTIKELRNGKGLTQFQLALLTGVTPNTIYAWEAGRKEPAASKLRALAKALDVQMDEIELLDSQAKKQTV